MLTPEGWHPPIVLSSSDNHLAVRPFSQGVHPSAVPGPAYLPMSQSLHSAGGSESKLMLNFPVSQLLQVLSDTASDASELFPASHSLQTSVPELSAKRPGSHGRHRLADPAPLSVLYLPMTQSMHTVGLRAARSSEYRPGLHGMQSAWPVSPLYLPAKQLSHVDSVDAPSVSEYSPASHSSHAVEASWSPSNRPGVHGSQCSDAAAVKLPSRQTLHAVDGSLSKSA